MWNKIMIRESLLCEGFSQTVDKAPSCEGAFLVS